MGFRFRKSVNLGGGVRVNVSKSGIGYSVGAKGVRVTKSAKGEVYGTLSAPGTGISYRTKSIKNTSLSNKSQTQNSLIEISPLHTQEQQNIIKEINEIILETQKKMTQLKRLEFNIKSIKYCNIIWAIFVITIPIIFVYKKWREKMEIQKSKIEKELNILKYRCKELESQFESSINNTVINEYDESNNDLAFELNQKGMEFEKNKDIDNAIKYYELSIENNFEGTYPYDRLAILYRKKKDYCNEIRVIEKAIEIFENIQNQGHRDVSTTINKFKDRLGKAQKLQQKNLDTNI